jgi:ATP-binding protein involved in chromosome partitioning
MTNPDNPIEQAVSAVVDPAFFYSLDELGLVRSVEVNETSTEIVISVPGAGHPAPRELVEEIARAVAAAGGAPGEVALEAMGEAEEVALGQKLHELGHPPGQPAATAAAGGHAHDDAGPAGRQNPFAAKSSRTRVIAVSSGKGGVGKSTVTVNLAVALARRGASVAILDADVYGFSVPSMLGIDRSPSLVGELLIPPVAHGVRCISMGFFVEEDQAVMWRGPMLHKALEQFLVDVHWGPLDFLVLDLPPGTGDVAMSIAQFVPRAEVIVVTTPQPAAERVAQRAAVLARQLRLPVLVHGRRRQALRAVRQWWRRGAGEVFGSWPVGPDPVPTRAAPGWRRRRARGRLRARRRGRAGLCGPSRASRGSRPRAGVPLRAVDRLRPAETIPAGNLARREAGECYTLPVASKACRRHPYR